MKRRANMRFCAASKVLLPAILAVAAGTLSCGAASRKLPPAAQSDIEFQGRRYSYSVFVPSSRGPGHALPALLLLHGAGGNGADFVKTWQDLAEKRGIILVAPTLPPVPELESQMPELFRAIMEQVKKQEAVDSRRIYVMGYSAGGYLTFDAAMFDSTYFAAAGVFAGIITPDYYWILRKAQRKMPVAMYIGDQDQFFSVAQTRAVRDLLTTDGFTVHYIELINQDHNYATTSHWVNEDMWTFMEQYALP